MMTLQNLYEQARKLLAESTNPLFFYHDDPDGLCSYLILKRFYKKGHGHMVKASPYLTEDFLPRQIDVDATIKALVRQVRAGNFGRPRLVKAQKERKRNR